jgi:hypothetical protein
MRKKHFKLGMVILVGLAGYFLALSAVLVASAGLPQGRGFGAGPGKTSHTEGEQAANVLSSGKFSGHGFGLHAAGTGESDDNPCLASAAVCGSTRFDQDADGSSGGQGAGDSIVTGGKGGPFGDRNFSYPPSYGFNFFGPGGTASGGGASGGGTSGSSGAAGGSSQNGGGEPPTGVGSSPGGTPPDFAGPGPGNSPSPSGPSIVTEPQISPFLLPPDPPGASDPGPSAGDPSSPPSDPAPPSDDPSKPYTVPEPSTFWILLGSLAAALIVLHPTRRAWPTLRCARRHEPFRTRR